MLQEPIYETLISAPCYQQINSTMFTSLSISLGPTCQFESVVISVQHVIEFNFTLCWHHLYSIQT